MTKVPEEVYYVFMDIKEVNKTFEVFKIAQALYQDVNILIELFYMKLQQNLNIF